MSDFDLKDIVHELEDEDRIKSLEKGAQPTPEEFALWEEYIITDIPL